MGDEKLEIEPKEQFCPRCGLRSYNDVCRNCNNPIIDKSDDYEEEEPNWRERKM